MKVIVYKVRRPRRKLSRREIQRLTSLRRLCAATFMAIEAVKWAIPAPVLAVAAEGTITGATKATVAAATFGIGGPGFIILEVLLITIVGGITATIASTIGYGNISRLLIFVGTLACIGLICDLAGGVVNKVLDFAGVV